MRPAGTDFAATPVPPALAEPGGWYGPRHHVGSLDLVRLTEEGRIERC